TADAHSLYCTSPTTATARSRPLSLHDALPIFMLIICLPLVVAFFREPKVPVAAPSGAAPTATADSDKPQAQALEGIPARQAAKEDRKSTRLNSSHVKTSYAVFCLKKKKSCKAI